MPLTDEQLADFRTKGFVVLKDFFNNATMQRVSRCLDTIRTKQSEGNLDAKYYEKSPVTGENMLVRIENIIGDHNDELSSILLSSESIDALSRILGETPILFKDKINYKLPGCREDKLHQDQAAGWGQYCDFFVTMVVAVDENRRENAAMAVLKTGNYERRLMTEEWQPLADGESPYSREEEYAILEVDPGDVIFFDAYVTHGSPANTSQKGRRNIFLTFNRLSEGDNRARYYQDKWKNYGPNKHDDARAEDSFLV